MAIPTPPSSPAAPAPQNGSQSVPWWIYNVIVAVVGLVLVGLGVFDHDNQALIDAGLFVLGGSAGHSIGKVSPTPTVK